MKLNFDIIVTMKSHARKFDNYTSRQVSRMPIAWRKFFTIVSFFGLPIITFSLTGAFMLVGLLQSSSFILTGGIVAFLTLAAGTAIKLTFRRRRPETDYVRAMFVRSYSFPSGHSVGGMVVYGFVALYALLNLASPLAAVVASFLALAIFLIGLSRVYLGAHYPSDVLGGWTLGLVGLLAIIYLV